MKINNNSVFIAMKINMNVFGTISAILVTISNGSTSKCNYAIKKTLFEKLLLQRELCKRKQARKQ